MMRKFKRGLAAAMVAAMIVSTYTPISYAEDATVPVKPEIEFSQDGKTYTDYVLNDAGDAYVSKTETSIVMDSSKEATCTQPGEIVYGTKDGQKTITIATEAQGHKPEVTKEAQKPTHIADGWTEETKCSVCGEVLTASTVIPKTTEHSYTIDTKTYDTTTSDYKAPTCEAGQGHKILACECGEKTVEDKLSTIPAKDEHTYDGNWIVVKLATCEEAGVKSQKCTVCGQEKSEEIESKGGHEWVVDGTKPATTTATCIEDGIKTTYYKCKNCDETKSEETEDKACGHDYAVTDTKQPTCDEEDGEGFIEYTCQHEGCDSSYKETIPALENHATVNDTKSEPVITYTKDTNGVPDCTLGGTKTTKQICSVCGKALEDKEEKVAAAATHTWKTTEKTEENTNIVSKESCVGKGIEGSKNYKYECTTCGKVVYGVYDETTGKVNESATEKIPTHPCDYSILYETVTPATCTEDGIGYYKCSECGKKETYSATITKLGHKYTSEVTKAATCTEEGVITYTCQNEGCKTEDKTYTEKISMIDHTWSDVVITKYPTCTDAGVGYRTCTKCQKKNWDYEIPATGHSWSDETSATANVTLTIPDYKNSATKGVVKFTCKNVDKNTGIACTEEANKAVTVKLSVEEEPGCETTGTAKATVEGKVSHGKVEVELKDVSVTLPAVGHTMESDPILVSSTTETGKWYVQNRDVCKDCGLTREEDTLTTVTAHADDEVTYEVKEAAKCGVDGKLVITVTCKDADEPKVTTVKIPALEHDELIEIPAIDATCTEAGSTAGTKCSKCGEVQTKPETIPATGHSEETKPVVEAKDPTCTEAGTTAGEKCSVCDAVLVKPETIPATGHSEETKPVVEAKDPTCTADGITAGEKCSVCGEVLVGPETIKATGHSKETKPVVAAKAPTCTADGTTAGEKCSVCDAVLVEPETIPATGHSEKTEAVVEAKDPTCTAAGTTAGKKCSVCGEVLEVPVSIDALGHDYETIPSVAATCTTDGKTTGLKCKRGDSVVEGTVIKATGHDSKIEIPAVAATCTTDGKTAGTKCSVDGVVTKAQTTVKATGHTIVKDAAVAATYTTTGKTAGEHCTKCDYKVEQKTVAKLAKKTQKITAKTTSKKYKVSAVKKKAQSFSISASATDKKNTKLTYKKSYGSKYLTVSKSGKVTIKKGTKKGSYSMLVKVSATATTAYKSAYKYVTIKVVVK
jgi:hypothetical protein